MREIGGKIKSMGLRLSLVVTAVSILETMKTTKSVVMEYSNGQTEAATRVIGVMTNNTVGGFLSIKME